MSKVDVDGIIKQKDNRNNERSKEINDFATSVPTLNDWKSPEIDKLAEALSKVQGELEGAKKDSKNPYFASTYADLHKVISSSFPTLSKYELSVTQGNEICGAAVCVTTTLMHKSGQWIRSKVKLPMEKKTCQSVGAAITYGRRYGLSAIVGIAQYDADGNDTK